MVSLQEIKNNPFYRFIIISGACYLCWFVCYDLYLKENGVLDHFLGKTTSLLSVKLLQWLGYNSSYVRDKYGLIFFFNDGNRILQMVPACNGQVLYPLFIGFIVATPGFIKDKFKMILLGCITIFIVNALRVTALCLIKINVPQYLAFNHKYTFTVLVYGFIFSLWLIWINYYVPKSVNANQK